MAILTLTTDLGTRDHYVAAIKGSILSLSPAATIVDISHNIPSFDFYKAAYIVKNSFYYFPEKTVHLIGVTPFSTKTHSYIAADYKNHFFIGSDSGMFSAIFDAPAQQLIRITGIENTRLKTFSVLDLPIKAAAKLLNGAKLSELGEKIEKFNEKNFLTPFVSNDSIDGYVTHVDKFENLITDIDMKLFYETGKNRTFNISFKKYDLGEINTHYEEVIPGELVGFFNFQGFLEIAINYGKASTLMHFVRGDKIKIIFDAATNS